MAGNFIHDLLETVTTVRNILNLLNKISLDAIADGYLRHSPMGGVRKPKAGPKNRGRALKPNEIHALISASGPQIRVIVLSALLTGMRRGELFGLRWEDLDWEANIVRISRELFWRYGKRRRTGQPKYDFLAPKSEASIREVDLSPRLKTELRERYLQSQKAGLVFCTDTGSPLHPDNVVKRHFKPAVARAGIEGNVRFNDLRHTFGALKIEQGANVYYIQRQMGHSASKVTLDVYGHLLESRKPEEAAKTDRLLFGE